MKSSFFKTTKDKEKLITIVIHVMIWLAIFLLPYILNPDYEPELNRVGHPKTDFRELDTATKILWLGLFYFNAFVLVPRLVYRRKFIVYVLSLVGLFGGIMLVHGILYNLIIDGRPFHLLRSLGFNLVPFAFTVILSTAYQSITDQIRTERLLAEKKNENLKTELSLLRSQVSPHFMFNIMNNMVALARKQSDQLEPSLIKLSSLMRYMLYETDDDKVLLEKEVEYVKSYIDLQQLRFGKNVKVNVNIQNVDGGHEIEPMLLIPFVENAFKHGTGLIECAQIDIEMSVKNNILYFLARNKYNENSDEVKDKTSGIGLTNVQRRLNLLYGIDHSLLINRKDNWFTVSLQLNLH